MREKVPRLLTFAMKPFGRRQLESGRVAAAMSGKEAAMRFPMGWGAGSDLGAKKRLKAKRRDDVVRSPLSTVRATCKAEAFFIPFFPFRRPEPPTCR